MLRISGIFISFSVRPVSQNFFFAEAGHAPPSGISSEKYLSVNIVVVGQYQKRCAKVSSGGGRFFARVQKVHALLMGVIVMCDSLVFIGSLL